MQLVSSGKCLAKSLSRRNSINKKNVHIYNPIGYNVWIAQIYKQNIGPIDLLPCRSGKILGLSLFFIILIIHESVCPISVTYSRSADAEGDWSSLRPFDRQSWTVSAAAFINVCLEPCSKFGKSKQPVLPFLEAQIYRIRTHGSPREPTAIA